MLAANYFWSSIKRIVSAGAAFIASLGLAANAIGAPPTKTQKAPLQLALEQFAERAVSTGVPKDGIPAIDRPVFIDAEEAQAMLKDDDIVFGVAIDGEAKAYPRQILVWHEIVNDELAKKPVAITYCPLTGTAIGFHRGDTTFGVSGKLVNSNLIMYDRATGSEWPQMLGIAIRGSLEGEQLNELPVLWTTWERWRAAYPDTRVLSQRTGYARNYSRDPYGDYTPATSYYAEGGPVFPTMNRDRRLSPKTVVVGARAPEAAVAFAKDAIREDRIAHLEAGGARFTAVHDPALDVVHIYKNPEGRDFVFRDGAYHADGESWEADALPLSPLNSFDAMWFAWASFYPDTELYE